MPTFKLPLSGDVAQTINPWTLFFNPTGNQFGLVNITLGQSSAPEVEREVLEDVGTYGKQLGRIGDVLTVLLKHFHPHQPLTAEETKAIDALNAMLSEIAAIKQKHHRPAMTPGGSGGGPAS